MTDRGLTTERPPQPTRERFDSHHSTPHPETSGPKGSSTETAIRAAHDTLTSMANVGLMADLKNLTKYNYGYDKLSSSADLKQGDIVDTHKPENKFSPVVIGSQGEATYWDHKRTLPVPGQQPIDAYRLREN